MAKLGISNLHYAVMTTEDSVSANPVYDTVKKPTAGMISVDINVNTNEATLYADNILWESEQVFQNATMDMTVADLPMDFQADIMGHNYDDTTKTLIKNANDVAPYVAIGFEFNLSKGKKGCVWMLKGKFGTASMSGQTKGENTEYGTNDITGTFAALKGKDTNTGRWQVYKEVDAGESTDTFFATVPLAQ